MLQEEVRRMIKDESSDIWHKLELINDVKRLGLSYHYDKEIAEALLWFHSSARFNATIVNRSLHETAMCFRLLREYGYDVNAGIPNVITFSYYWKMIFFYKQIFNKIDTVTE